MDQNMQNGLPPPPALIQKNPYILNNGLGSSQSSRDSSPILKMSNIPPSQLPPNRGQIPASQLPPGRPSVSPIMGPQNVVKSGQSVSAIPGSINNLNQITPQSSPRINNFNTSTPILQANRTNNSVPQVTSSVQTQIQQKPNIAMANVQTISSVVSQSQNLPMKPNLNQMNIPRPVNSHEPQNNTQAQPVTANISPQNIPIPASNSQFPQNLQTTTVSPVMPSYFMQQARQIPNQVPQNRENLNQNIEEKKTIPLAPHPIEINKNVLPQQQQQRLNTVPTSQTNLQPQITNYPQSVQPIPSNQINYVSQPQSLPPMPNAPQNFAQKPQMNPSLPPQYPTQTSSIHAKRYPQQPYQNYPQQNVPQSVSQVAQNVPAMSQNIPQNVPQQNFQTTTPNMYGQQYNTQPTVTYMQNVQKQNYQRGMTQQMSNLSVAQQGFNRLWGTENYDLLNCPNILPTEQMYPPKVRLGQDFLDAANCSPEIFRCTMTKIPESKSLLQKSRLPLGVLIHPFKDLNHLPVIQCNTIVRCRACRTYINPFVFFVDTKRWKCNLCYRINELPEEFQYDPVSKSYGDPSRRPEIKSSTIEYIAPSEYMLRPPQPAVYLFLLDISRLAVESGYLQIICDVLSTQLLTLPGDARTQIGFLAYNSTLHFYSLAEGLNQPHEMTVMDIDDIFLPCPDNLLINLKEGKELVSDLLAQLPTRYNNSYDNGSALGSALQAAFKLMSGTGGRITVFQTCLPTIGPGALTVREDPNQRSGKDAPFLNPATDFYKRLALDCSGQQIAVDLFILNSQYVDIATLSGISRFSGGCVHHFPLFKSSRTLDAESLERCFRRYLTRKIGFEAVMRIRCTRGLAIHTFYGNFFVRSTDLLSLPNVNPDAGFGMQVSIEESLTDLHTVCFQAALLYTSSKGERRIRVHTLCLPVVSSLPDILNSADQQCIVGLLAKMAVDRSQQASLSDARDAFINVAIDILSSYKISLNTGNSSSGLFAPESLKLLPLYILALLKHAAFRVGQSTRLDDRVYSMCEMKTLPLTQLLQSVYPDLYPVHCLTDEGGIVDGDDIIPQPPRLQLTSRNIDSNGAYLLDAGQQMLIMVCPNVSPAFLTHSLGIPSYNSISDQFYELPKIDNPDSHRLHNFINSLNDEKPYCASLQIMRENSPNRIMFLEHLIEDRLESALSYNEFLQHIKTQVK